MNKLLTTLVPPVIVVLAACSSNPDTIDSIATARSAIAQVENLPNAGVVAAEEVDQARIALRNAESLAEKGGARSEIDHAAYLAKRHADIAQEQVKRAESRKIVADADAERERVLLEARAMDARRQAAQAAEEARRSGAQVEDVQRRNQMLEEQLAALNAKKTERGMVLTLGDVLFDTGKSALKPGAQSTIDRLAEFMKNSADSRVVIEGHTDSMGGDDYNMGLSQQRANSVREALLSKGIGSERISAVGKGEAVPVASNDTMAGRQQNRRVEVIIQNTQSASTSGG
jgi:OmpA-OmpF porin, OOP family